MWHHEEIIINKRSKLDDAPEDEVSFEYDHSLKKKEGREVAVGEALILEVSTDPVSFSGRITFTGPQQTLTSKGRKLIKQECILTDESGSIRLVLWENDIADIISGETYSIHDAVVKSFNSQNYVTFNRQTEAKILEGSFIRKEDDAGAIHKTTTTAVNCPAKGIQL
eukprot:gene13192-14539_t